MYPFTALASLTVAGVVVRDIGPIGYGTIALVTGLSLLIPFADLGLSAAIVNAYAQSDAKADHYVRVAWWLLCFVSAFLAGIFFIIHLVFGWDALLGLGEKSASSRVVLFVLIAVVASFPLGVGQRILVGTGRVTLATLAQVTFPVASLAFTLAVHYAHAWQYYFYVPSAAQFLTGAVTMFMAMRIRRIDGRCLVFPVVGTRSDLKYLLSAGARMAVIVTGLAIAFQSDRIILSHLGGRLAVSQYSIGMTLYVPAWAAISTMGLHLWPHFARQRMAEGDGSDFWPRWRQFCLIGTGASIGFFVLAPPMTEAWSKQSLPWELWLLFSCLLCVQTMHLPAGMYLTDSEGLRFQAVCVSVMALANVTISIIATPWLGSRGPLLASVLCVAGLQLAPGLWRLRGGRTAAMRASVAAFNARPHETR